jgi:carboxymethylenebutenolidase
MDTVSNPPPLSAEQQSMLSMWQQHMHAEFVLKDADAALATMTDHPYLYLVSLGMGRVGRAAVREFYANTFLPDIPPDFEVETVALTIGTDRIVEEIVGRFTHTIEVDWILPGVRPTNRRIEIAAAVVVGFEAGKIAYERLYWDQAAVLAQAGVIDHPMAAAGVASAAQLLSLSTAPGVSPELQPMFGRATARDAAALPAHRGKSDEHATPKL